MVVRSHSLTLSVVFDEHQYQVWEGVKLAVTRDLTYRKLIFKTLLMNLMIIR